MQRDMLGFIFLSVFVFVGFCSYFLFRARLWFGRPKEEDTVIDQQKEEADQSWQYHENGSEASASEYGVFLSFRGPDSRQGFADVLYSDMVSAGIRVFMDDNELEVGDEISKILQAIESSKICVPIFSKTFAASAWCLREVERMVELKKKIVPVFYTVTPDDVKLATELFKKDLRKHEKKYGREQVKKWEDALKTVAKIKGREVKDTRFAEFSKLFVRALEIKLKVKLKYVTDFLVEREDQEQAVMKLLDIDEEDERLVVGLHGMGGVGKTTLAKVVFNRLTAKFDCCSFLENVQELLRSHGPDYLPRQLLEDLNPKLKYFEKVDSIGMLREYFRDKKVLIVLDDVYKRKDIEIIVRTLGWFGSGSRILVTTRDRGILTKEARAFEVQEMNEDQALQLFSKHAFGEDSPPSDYQTVSSEVVSLTGRLPLAIEVMGSLLHQREKNRWRATIDKLKKIPIRDVHEKLKISFDALEYEQKQIFLDIACFFINEQTSSANYMWEACDFFPDDGIQVLVSMSLIKITWEDKFSMHDLIRDLGRELVRQECLGDPAKRSRIWSHKDALEVLKIKQGKEQVEGLFLEEASNSKLTNEEFSSFRSLRLLKLVETKLEGNFDHLLPKLKWFSWHRCPPNFTAANLSSENLVVLDLTWSSISENWAGWSLIRMAKSLKVLDLTRCFNLTSTPDLSVNDTLERLVLRGCRNLARIHSSISKLKRLKHLDLEGCSSLGLLPEEVGLLEDLEEILVEGSGNTFHLPESIGNLRSLSVIKLRRVEITRIPDSIRELVNLTRLSIHDCMGMKILPDAIGDLKSLLELDLCGTKLSMLPDSIGGLVKLQKLDLGFTKIEGLPDTIGDLKALVELKLSQAELRALPTSVGGLVKLELLLLGSTKIEELPNTIGDMESLVHLDLACTKLRVLPDSVGQLGKLEHLSLYSTGVKELPDAIGNLTSLRKLILSFTNLTALPDSVGQLGKLQTLELESSKLEELPDCVGDLKSLENLELSSSELRVLPDFVGDMSCLRRLRLERCKIKKLPSSIGKLTRLTELSAAGCKFLTEIPKEIGNLSALRELRLTDTLVAVPELSPTLHQLPHLQELKIAVFENPSSENEVCESTFQGFENLANSVRLTMTIDCSDVKRIPELPSTLLELELRNVTAETRLPDFSNLKNLENIEFYYCSANDQLESLRKLQTLKEMILFSCSNELIEFSIQLENFNEMTIVESSAKVLDLPHSIKLLALNIRGCNEVCEIRGIGKLESLGFFRITDCPSLEMVGNLSEMRRLHTLRIINCPQLREVEGLDGLFLEDISIHDCGSLRNIDALKQSCRRGYLNGVEVQNNADEGDEYSGGFITQRSLELFLKLSTEQRSKDNQNQAPEEGVSHISPGTTPTRMEQGAHQAQGEEYSSHTSMQQFPAANTWSMGIGAQNENEGICRSGDVAQPGPSTSVQEQIEEMRRHIAELQQQQAALLQQVMQQQQVQQIALSQQMAQQQQVQQTFTALTMQVLNLIGQRLSGISTSATEPGQSSPHAVHIPTSGSSEQTNHGFPQTHSRWKTPRDPQLLHPPQSNTSSNTIST